MTRMKLLLAAALIAAIAGVTPAAHAAIQSCKGGGASSGCSVHVVGAGSSAQFNSAAIGADSLAINQLGGAATATQCVYHWTAKSAGFLIDNRGTVAIPLEPANMWTVWIASLDQTANITGYSFDSTGTILTFTTTNGALGAGQTVTITDTTSGANGQTLPIQGTPTATSFVVNFAGTPSSSGADTGSATTGAFKCPSSAGAGTISTGNNNITDVWLDASVDSTVGVRAFLAENTTANGGDGVAVEVIPVAAGNLLGTGTHILFPDNALDVSVQTGGATNLPKTIGTDNGGIADVHVNAGFTDITAPDAYFATSRAMGTLTATRTGLGYKSTTNVGLSILTSEGTGTKATPVKFGLYGNDPITAQPVRSYVSIPIGAAPIVFVYNNGGTDVVRNAKTGIIGDGGTNTGNYLLAKLFDGTTACEADNPALAGTPSGQAIHLFLREPLSGTMNTTEFTTFRTSGNSTDSQELGVNPTASINPDNPLTPTSQGGSCSPGDRSRAIGTGEVIGSTSTSTGVLGVPHALGYIFTSFANLAKFGGATTPANYNYLTLDNVDPFGFKASQQPVNQEFPNCAGPCQSSVWWDNSYSYPNLRNGSYKAWSIYRWLVPSTDTDPLGPTALASFAQSSVDNTVADYVPFSAQNCVGGTNAGAACTANAQCNSNSCQVTDGLAVYRSHRSITGTYAVGHETNNCIAADNPDCNGTPTAANNLDGGNTLGLGEAGGDVGGQIEGPFHTSTAPVAFTSGYVTNTGICTANKGWEIVKKTLVGTPNFDTTGSWNNQTITIGGVAYTLTNNNPTATDLWIGGYSGGACTGAHPANSTLGQYYYIGVGNSQAASGNGVDGKKE